MRALRIFVNNIELDHVREDVKIREENNSFEDSIKVAHSTRPIRIVENLNSLKALGEFSINASKKKKFFPCLVTIGAIRYNGILTQEQKLKGFRKCDIKFGSEVNGIMEKKIATFFPDMNVKGWDFFPAYNEESKERHLAENDWLLLEQSLAGKIYPDAMFQLPLMSYKDKFGTDLTEEDSWYDYRGNINHRILGFLTPNTFTRTENLNKVFNQTVIAPQVFVLSPIFYAFKSLGYALTGSVVSSSFFKRLLLLSFNDNMTKIVQSILGINVSMDAVSWQRVNILKVLQYPHYTYAKVIDVQMPNEGSFKFKYDFNMEFPEDQKHIFGVQIYWNGSVAGTFHTNIKGEYDGQFSFTVGEGQANDYVTVVFHSLLRISPESYNFEIIKDVQDVDFYDIHPTVDFSRYIPDWTVAEYLNNFAKLFNWKLDVDDVSKTLSINMNEKDYLLEGPTIPINKSVEILDPNNIEAESYILKYENDKDGFIYMDSSIQSENNTGDEETKTLQTKFKYVPHSGATSKLSETLEDLDGQGLVIYDPSYHPYTSASFNGLNLKIPGVGGIFNTYWKTWTYFRLNALNGTLKAPFTQTELYLISREKKIMIDNQLYLVKAIEYKENPSALFDTELSVEAVIF